MPQIQPSKAMSFTVVIPNAQRRHGGTVQRCQNSLSKERRWNVVKTDAAGKHYDGFFLARGKWYPGKATVSRSSIKLQLRHPPQGLRFHKHWPCFTAKRDGWFTVHHNRQASLEAAILELECILTEASRNSSSAPGIGSRPQNILTGNAWTRLVHLIFK